MSPSNEGQMSELVVAFLSNQGDVIKIESPLTSAGVPDLNFENSQVHNWLELKYVKHGVNDLGIRATQYQWFRDRVKAGGRPMMLVYVADDDMYYLVHGHVVWSPAKKLENVAQLQKNATAVSNSIGFALGKFLLPWR